jgi:Polycystin cation channel
MHPDNSLGALSACVIAMLWIRVLSYLKVINEQMALFVAALGQILVDARFLGVVLLVLIFMFGDMMQILVTSKDDGEFCESVAISSDPPAAIVDFCSGSRSAALLRV